MLSDKENIIGRNQAFLCEERFENSKSAVSGIKLPSSPSAIVFTRIPATV